MASITQDKKSNTKRIGFIDANNKRHYIRLGKIDMKMAETVKIYVEKLIAAQITNVSPDAETAAWIASLSDDFHARLAKTGLIPERRKVGTLGEMLPDIIKEKSVGNARATIAVYEQARESLYRFFGADRRVDMISATNVKEYSLWLAKNGRLKKSGDLSPKTVSKRMQHAFSFFDKMVEKEIISRNPFKGQVRTVAVDDRRNRYIDEKTILKVMECAPDAEWRLIIALWRFAGLRAVSEVLTLKWEDILWDQKEIVVHAPKTARYGKGIRIIPFFPHVEECLRDAFGQAPEGAIYVVEKHAPLHLRGKKERVDVSQQGNISTTFRKIIRRAGIAPWSKLIHNLRASFETDLLNGKHGKFALTTIAKWLGHSVKVMLEHYGRIQQSDFDQIAEACEQVKKKNEPQTGYEVVHYVSFPMQNVGLTMENIDSNSPKGVAQNAHQHTAVWGGIEGHEENLPSCNNSHHALENKAHEGSKRQEMASCLNYQNEESGGGGN